MINNFMIFGDSYSTYEGFIPDGYKFYYSIQGRPNVDVTRMSVDQTWWKRFINKTGANLILNNSWSGSTVCHTSRDGNDCSHTNSFIYRFRQLKEQGFFKQNQIDTVIVFGGTNDDWGKSPLGRLKFNNLTEKDLFSFKPAISYLASSLREELPNANLIFLINTNMKEQVGKTIKRVAERVNAHAVELHDIDKQTRHPTVKGMENICDQLIDYVNKNIK